MNNAYRAAHPFTYSNHDGTKMLEPGLTKREMFAMAAMQGLSSCPIPGSHNSPEEIAATAIRIADELLKRLES